MCYNIHYTFPQQNQNRSKQHFKRVCSSHAETHGNLNMTSKFNMKEKLFVVISRKKCICCNIILILWHNGVYLWFEFIKLFLSSRRKQSFDSIGSSDGPTELLRTRTLDFVHLKFNLEAGSLLPLALKGRLRHGRHFTFMSALNDTAVTLVSTSVNGSIADENHPFAAHGPWLQVMRVKLTINSVCFQINTNM